MTKKKSGIKVGVTRNEPKVVFSNCKFIVYKTKEGKTIVKCTVSSMVKSPLAFVDVDLCNRAETLGDNQLILSRFPYPATEVITKGVAVCDPRDEFDLKTGKRVARLRAEKKAFGIHRKALCSSVNKYVEFLQSSTKKFADKAERIEGCEILWDK